MRRKFPLSAATILIGALFVAGEVNSNPTGVPVPSVPQLMSCTTPSGGWTITAQPQNGAFPYTVPCEAAANSGKNCSNYKYTITGSGGTPDHVVFAISGDQDLDTVKVNSSVVSNPSVTPPGSTSGDQPTGFLFLAQHEYPIRINPTGNPPNTEFLIVGPSAPRISTALVKKGRLLESCLIAGPGVAGNAFQAVTNSATATVAAGTCTATLTFDAFGNLASVTAVPPCVTVSYPNGLRINGTLIRDNPGNLGITGGNSFWQCWGPSKYINPAICTCKPSFEGDTSACPPLQ